MKSSCSQSCPRRCNNMMFVTCRFLLLVLSALFVLVPVIVAHQAIRPLHAAAARLAKCPYEDETSEIQFYNATIELWNLPETCTEEDMVTIGVLIQSVVDEVEERMPQYEGEKSITLICPFPQTTMTTRRNLQTTTTTTTRRRRSGRRYKYSGTGRACRRCRNKTTARRRRRRHAVVLNSKDQDDDENACDLAERVHDDAEYSAMTCQDVLQGIKTKIEESGSENVSFILQQAKQNARDCQEQSRIAIEISTSVVMLCDKVSQLRASTDKNQVKEKTDVAVAAATRARNALAEIRRASFDLTTLLYMESRHDLQGRMLSDLGLCDYRDAAEIEYTRSKDACDTLVETLTTMNKSAASVDTKDVQDLVKKATSKNFDSKCENEVKRTEKFKDDLYSLCEKGKENDVKKAAKLYDQALLSTTKAEELLAGLLEFKVQLDKLNGGGLASDKGSPPSPTESSMPVTTEKLEPEMTTVPQTEATPLVSKTEAMEPETTQVPPTKETPVAATTAEEVEPKSDTPAIPAKISPIQEEYLNLLSSNLELADTSCEQVKKVMLQKSIAEETVLEGYKTYDEIMDMARGYEGNANVERIKDKAVKAQLRVEVEAGKARVSADLASELCGQKEQARGRGRKLVEESIDEEVDAATSALLESRLALSEERSALDEMEEAIALIEYDPTLDDLEITVKDDETLLVKHLDAVEGEIIRVDDQLQELPDTAPEAPALATKKDSLVQEEHQIEHVLTNQDHFLITESALKKDEYYETVAPDYVEFPPLRYVFTAARNGKDLTVETNWDRSNEGSNPKKSWFGRFGDYLVEDITAWLPMAYSDLKGGCITKDTEIAVDVVITELKTIWEKLNQQQCSPEKDDTQQPEPASCPGATAGPSPIGGKAIWSSAVRDITNTPYYQFFDGVEGKFKGSVIQGADGAERYFFAHGASSPVCYDSLFVGVGVSKQMGGTRFDGADWSPISIDDGKEGIQAAATDVRWRGIVGAYESISGRAMVVFNTGSGDSYLRYSVLDPETGQWSASEGVDPFYVGDEPKWLDIASDPNSNAIALAFSGTGRKIYAAVWNGIEWTPAIDISDIQYYAALSVAFEAQSGRIILVHGKRQDRSSLFYRIYDDSTWSEEQVAFSLGSTAAASWLHLRSDPMSNRLVLSAVIQNKCIYFAIWNGIDAFEAIDEATCNAADINFPTASVAFESDSGKALAVWSESGVSTVQYKTLENGSTTWSPAMSTKSIKTFPMTVDLFPNPDPNSNQVMLMVKDRGLGLFASPWDGSTLDSFTQLESNMGSGVKGPFSFLWNPVMD